MRIKCDSLSKTTQCTMLSVHVLDKVNALPLKKNHVL